MTTDAFAPPSTAWGALARAAEHVANAPGIARVDTLDADYARDYTDPYSALQDVLWPAEAVPCADGVPDDRVTGRPYWAALSRLDRHLGGNGHKASRVIEFMLERGDATPASVAAAMRAAAA